MKEIERMMVIHRINKDVKDKEALKDMYEELKVLIENPVVRQYLELLKNIESAEKRQHFFNSVEDMIYLEFVWAFNSRVKAQEIEPCTHDIWLYEGSYYWYEDPLGGHDDYHICDNENDKDFAHNCYECLECGKSVYEKDWKRFEDTHFVLKNQNHKSKFGVNYYRKLYYQLLYNNRVNIAREKVIKEFNRNKEFEKVKVK